MTPTMHDFERLVELIDGRLTADDEASVREHLASCEACRAELARLELARAALKATNGPATPASLSESIAAALDREDKARSRAGRRRVISWSLAAAAVVFLAVMWSTWRSRDVDLVEHARANVDVVLQGLTSPNGWILGDAATLEAAFVQIGGPELGIRVIDLAMMGWSLDGGMVTRVHDRPAALYAYRRADGSRLVCQMYEGTLEALPATPDIRSHRNFTFHVYEREGITLVFWREGRIVCVLAARLPREEVVQLAFEKAMRPV